MIVPTAAQLEVLESVNRNDEYAGNWDAELLAASELEAKGLLLYRRGEVCPWRLTVVGKAVLRKHLRLANDALSHQAKAGVLPVEKPERRKRGPKGLQRSQMERKPSTLKRTPLGHCTPEQKARVAHQVCIVCGQHFNDCEPAHTVPRGHPKMSPVAADDVRAVVPLCHEDHLLFDAGQIDLLPYLEPAWRDSQEWAAGAVGLATAMRSIAGASHSPQREGDLLCP